MIRTYPLKHSINKGKQEKIIAITKEYRKLAVTLATLQWEEFYFTEKMNKNLDIKKIKSKLSERYKQTCQYQVVGVLNSFIANRQNDFVRIVGKSKLEERKKIELFYINKYEKWFAMAVTMPAYNEKGEKIEGKSIKIEEETIRLARAIFKHVLKRHKKPCLKNCNLALDNKVAIISARENSEKKNAKKFDYWITFSTLEPRKQVYLPLSSNHYFDSKQGILKKFCQINLDEQNQINVCLIKDVEKRPYIAKTPKIALDFGLRNLFSTDKGDLYGRNFIDMLKKYDGYISFLAQNRQRQNLPVKSQAYNNLVSHLRNFLKNEINRVVGKIIEQYQPNEIVVENLNFTSPHLSSRMNRILSNMGRKIIQEKLSAIAEEFSITITFVSAPYTSQQCNVCGYVSANNRPTQATFVCQHCHNKIHADVNAARNIFDRSSIKELHNIYLNKSVILSILIAIFLQRYPNFSTCASSLFENNPYFHRKHNDLKKKDALNQISNTAYY